MDTLPTMQMICWAPGCTNEVIEGQGHACSLPGHKDQLDEAISQYGSGVPGDNGNSQFDIGE